MMLDPYLIPYTKTNTKTDRRLKTRPKTINSRGLIPKIYKELLQLNITTTIDSKIVEGLEWTFL